MSQRSSEVTQLFLIRHGSTKNNEIGLLQGVSTTPLSDLGREQARGVAALLENYTIDTIYTSDINRAVETAQIINVTTRCAISEHAELRERNYGEYDGLNLEAVIQQRAANGVASIDPFHDWHEVAGVETDEKVYRRFSAFLSPLLDRHAGRTFGIVTHSGVIQSFLYGIYQIPPERKFAFRIARGCVFHFMQRHNFMEMQAYYPDTRIFLKESTT